MRRIAQAGHALLLVTHTPDYIAPPTSNIIQGRLGLKQDMLCLDINQACAGFVIGLALFAVYALYRIALPGLS